MANYVPWYYKLYWKMEGWLASKVYNSLDHDRGFFKMMLRDGKRSAAQDMRLRPVPVDNRGGALHLRHKPLSETIRQG